MNPRRNVHRLARWIGALTIALTATATWAEGIEGYGFAAAAQEVSQLFWLAETANVCGWATKEEALKFEQFSLRFLSAHLSATNMRALASLVGTSGYESTVRRAAEEGSPQSCAAARWHDGWLAYKTAADSHERDF